MADQGGKRDRKHFYLKDPKANVFAYSPKLPPFEKKLLPKGQRQKQANKIKAELAVAIKEGLEAAAQADGEIVDKKKQGFYLQFTLSDALGFIDGLENATKKISIKNLTVLDPEKGTVSVVVYAYYGVTGNARALSRYLRLTERAWCKWLNRRNHRAHMTWARFKQLLHRYPLLPPRVVHSIYPRAANP